MSLDSSQTRTKSLSAMFSARWGEVRLMPSFKPFKQEAGRGATHDAMSSLESQTLKSPSGSALYVDHIWNELHVTILWYVVLLS
jgi:hypothetical protein